MAYARFARYFTWPDTAFLNKPVAEKQKIDQSDKPKKEMGKIEKIKDVIKNDLELYFYLYKDKEKWYFEIQPSYLERARTDRMSFEQIFEEYCIDNHYTIIYRGIDKTGVMWFCVDRENRSILKPKNGIYDTPMTTKRQ